MQMVIMSTNLKGGRSGTTSGVAVFTDATISFDQIRCSLAPAERESVLIDRRNLSLHRPWIIFVVVVAVAAAVWHFIERGKLGEWPGGGSLSGFAFGVAGGLICLFEFALWIKKKPKLRNLRIGRAQTWLRAHIWLGLLSVPLLLMHSGWRLGGTLSSWVMVLFLVVIATGVIGLILQQILPKLMLDQVPAETIYSQIDHQVDLLIEGAQQWIDAAHGGHGPARDGAARPVEESYVVSNAVRTAGRVQGKVLEARVPALDLDPPEAETLQAFFDRTLVPYLREGQSLRSPLSGKQRADEVFRELRGRLSSKAEPVVDALERASHQRRQYDQQSTLHFWLHSWLWLHFPLSVALIVLMLAHAFYALWYL